MSRQVFVHFLPSLFDPGDLRGGTAVMIDVLRASTTICHALHAGATAVVPCAEVDAARETAAAMAGESPVLGGERGGELIDGFDLDNSPLRYTTGSVGGRTVVFTSTNGTRALMRCSAADQILLASFVNLGSVIAYLDRCRGPIHLVSAGTRGEISAEDVLCAGAIACGLKRLEQTMDVDADDQARMSAELFGLHCDRLPDALAESRGGRNCRKLGFATDIARAAEVDRFDLVPMFSPETGRITAFAR
ncbi:MAG: 2-phosphosulfolactate phosphatase [Planctomycetaceae bacterium]